MNIRKAGRDRTFIPEVTSQHSSSTGNIIANTVARRESGEDVGPAIRRPARGRQRPSDHLDRVGIRRIHRSEVFDLHVRVVQSIYKQICVFARSEFGLSQVNTRPWLIHVFPHNGVHLLRPVKLNLAHGHFARTHEPDDRTWPRTCPTEDGRISVAGQLNITGRYD